jgi:hypothetical protein
MTSQQGQVIMLVPAWYKTICEKQLAQTRHLASHPRTKQEQFSPIATDAHFWQVEEAIEASGSSSSVAFLLLVSECPESDDPGGISVSRFIRLILEADQVNVVEDKVRDMCAKFRIY